ncbi:hypothetical protein TNCT_166181 [Trichonephila clavata]|uniref:Secreted protein n=1 Tax=Trichonephila clavata TaxID=2740835 RepID=A0A8X6HG05_TRICU|nr:hypothetical protein TNCT_166181 [Trichonephila clavata]
MMNAMVPIAVWLKPFILLVVIYQEREDADRIACSSASTESVTGKLSLKTAWRKLSNRCLTIPHINPIVTRQTRSSKVDHFMDQYFYIVLKEELKS